ncbi:hypothetical protein WR25_18174 [Diploscapter pachys]|uniref:Uncharacterized protein n=1 Tax=Diploscapter pachys TaxID=2018661 RepID=A0A2A2JHS6_9BILA|nr:hypothetical protein WR25_18174 [Diploscapter pachys]
MMKLIIAAAVLVAIAYGQVQIDNRDACQVARSTSGNVMCSRSVTFRVSIDGQQTTVRCSDPSAQATDRCPGCCQAAAIALGLPASAGSGFASTTGGSSQCVCCIQKPRC